MRVKNIVLFVVLLCVCNIAVGRQPPSPYERYRNQLDSIEKFVASNEEITLGELNKLHEEVVEITQKLSAISDDLSWKIERTSGERKEEYTEQKKVVNELLSRANAQLSIIRSERVTLQTIHLFQRKAPLTSTQALKKVVAGGVEVAQDAYRRLIATGGAIYHSLFEPFTAILWGVWLLCSAIVFVIGWWIRKKFGYKKDKTDIAHFEKEWALIVSLFSGAIIPLGVILAFGFMGYAFDLLQFSGSSLVIFYIMLASIILGVDFVKSFFAPKYKHYALVHMEPERAQKLYRRIGIFIVFLSARLWLDHINDPLHFTQLLEFAVQIVVSVQALVLLSVAQLPKIINLIVGLIAIACPILIFIGYIVLADFLLHATALTFLLYFTLRALFALFSKAAQFFLSHPKSPVRRAKTSAGETDFVAYWVNLIIGATLACVGLYVFLLIWGMDYRYLTSMVHEILFGISVGDYTFSLMSVILAIAIFVIVFSLTRYAQNVLNTHIFPYTKFDTGLKHALSKTVGYIGVVLALVFSVRTLGIDLSSVLFILGGLSVGIGLGLQNIVANFISGIVMLIERPVKIGDIIQTQDGMGTVKRINVRTTEIETFERTIILIPNSQVISTSIINWTRNNAMIRIEIKVGVAYGSDTEKVQAVLLESAKAQEHVLAAPPPYVIFSDFGDSYYEFLVRIYIDDIANMLVVGTELRHAFVHALEQNDINIPFPNLTVHLGDQSIPQKMATKGV